FRAALNSGHMAERAWVKAQRDSGRSAAHGKKLLLANHSPIKDHCGTPDAAVLMSVEIKERSLKFTCPEDFPYPTVFVDDLRGLGREFIHPFAYVFLSSVTGKWVWITPLDRDASWEEKVVKDNTRGHDMGMLVAPKGHLRHADELEKYLYPHDFLEFLDGDTALFVTGGGEVEERDRYVAKAHPDVGGRGKSSDKKTRKHMG
ncbi:MAG: hypothetical protein EBR82_70815, partial [Caulobacteraceae bacterium]|nr:hypothetical protein [Caulobacteraceae bacterium]